MSLLTIQSINLFQWGWPASMRPLSPTPPSSTIRTTSSTIPNCSSDYQPYRKVEITVSLLCCWSRDCARCRRRKGSPVRNRLRGWPNMKVLLLSCRSSMSISCLISWTDSIPINQNHLRNHSSSIRRSRLSLFRLEIYRVSTYRLTLCDHNMSVNPSTHNISTNNLNSRVIILTWPVEAEWTEAFQAITIPRLSPSKRTRDHTLTIPVILSWEEPVSICSRLMSSCRCRENCSLHDTTFFIKYIF